MEWKERSLIIAPKVLFPFQLAGRHDIEIFWKEKKILLPLNTI